MLVNGESLDEFPNPFLAFAEDAFPQIVEAVTAAQPDLIISSLFTFGLTDKLASAIGTPWCHVNPAYVFGAGSPRSTADDYGGPFAAYSQRNWIGPVLERTALVLHTTDREYDPVTAGFPSHHHQVGPLNFDRQSETPDYLLEEGAPWALVSVATGAQPGELAIVENALQALADRDLRVLATVPGRAGEITGVPSNATVVDFASHDEVLKHSRLAISHAGHGLVMRALGRGVPMVLVPWGRDQPGVAFRAKQLGVAEIVEPVELNQETISVAINRVLSNETMRNKSREVAARLADEDSVGTACDLLESVVSND